MNQKAVIESNEIELDEATIENAEEEGEILSNIDGPAPVDGGISDSIVQDESSPEADPPVLPQSLPKGPVGRPASKRPPTWTYAQWSNKSQKQRDVETKFYNQIAGDRAWGDLTNSEKEQLAARPNAPQRKPINIDPAVPAKQVFQDNKTLNFKQIYEALKDLDVNMLKEYVNQDPKPHLSDFLPSNRMIKKVQRKSYCLAAAQAPAMPVVTGYVSEHRPRISLMPPLYNACVARSLTMKEMTSHAAGRAAQDSEWSRLRKAGAWNESGVREWAQVSAEAKRTGRKHHVGRVFEVNVEKGSELPVGHPGRKFKCRVVFQGSNVRDEHNQWALFQDLSSCPATMQAAKAADVIGLFGGNDVQQADAEQAYI